MGGGGSKRLSDREEILKVAHILLDARTGRTGAGIDARVDQILLRSFESEEGRRVDAIAQVDPKRPHRRAVANAKPYGVHHVIEVLQVLLVDAKGDCSSWNRYCRHRERSLPRHCLRSTEIGARFD